MSSSGSTRIQQLAWVLTRSGPELVTSKSTSTHLSKKTPKLNICVARAKGIADLKQGDQFQSDSETKVEIFNNQFTSVFTKEDTTNITSLGDSLSKHSSFDGVYKWCWKTTQRLESYQSTGSRWNPPWFLRPFVTELAPILTDLFQTSFDSSEVPDS